ncbi:MAG: DUF4407 domain-containing protein [Cyanobacteria bacterium P01_G01_bin.54]
MSKKSNINPIIFLLSICGGAHPTVIRRAYSQANNFAGIGAGIILISVLGGVSSGYALFTFFESIVISSWGGAGFGLTLGYLDRSIISSMRKYENPSWTDRVSNFGVSTAKILGSALISVIVATPLQMKIFEKSIDAEVRRINQEKISEFRDKKVQEYASRQRELQNEKENYQKDLKVFEEKVDQARTDYQEEVTVGGPDVGRDRGIGPVAEDLARLQQLAEKDYERRFDLLNPRIQEIERRIRDINTLIENDIEDQAEILEKATDILARLNAFQSIQEAENPVVWGFGFIGLASLGITLLFVMIDGTTMTIRLLAPRSSYDKILDEYEKENEKIEEKERGLRLKEIEIRQRQFRFDQESKENKLAEYERIAKADLDSLKREARKRLDADKEFGDRERKIEAAYRERALKRLEDIREEKIGTEVDQEKLLDIVRNGFSSDLKNDRSYGLPRRLFQGKGEKNSSKELNISQKLLNSKRSWGLGTIKELSDISLVTGSTAVLATGRLLSDTTSALSQGVVDVASQGLSLVVGWRGLNWLGRTLVTSAFLLGSIPVLLVIYLFFEWNVVKQKYDVQYIPYPDHINSPIMFDRNGIEIKDRLAHALEPEQKLSYFSKTLVDTLILSEDRRFERHNGVDLIGLARALAMTLMGNVQGGSTLTQQIAKKQFIEQDRISPQDPNGENNNVGDYLNKIRKKVHQILLAIQIENEHSKDSILEAYLNRIYLGNEYIVSDKGELIRDEVGDPKPKGSRIFGFEEAARFYFNKPASDLNIQESAFLVSLLPGPQSIYINQILNTPESCTRKLRKQRQVVEQEDLQKCIDSPRMLRNARIEQLLARKKITPEAAQNAMEASLETNFGIPKKYTWNDNPEAAEDFQALVSSELKEIFEGEWGRNSNAHYIVETTLDMEKQKKAQDAVDNHIREYGKGYSYASLISIDATDGSIISLVDGAQDKALKDSHIPHHIKFSSKSVNRRLASTFKIFPFLLVIENKIIASTKDKINCSEISESILINLGTRNCEDMSIEQGFVESSNPVAWYVTNRISKEEVIDFAEKAGIKQIKKEFSDSPQKDFFIPLGLGRSNLLDITSVYGMVANGGVKSKPYTIRIVRDPNNCVDENNPKTCAILYERNSEHSQEKIVSSETAEEVMELLEKVVERGTARGIIDDNYFSGKSLRIGGKTGTSTKKRDLWFIGTMIGGSSPETEQRVVTGVWLGTCAVPPKKKGKYFDPYDEGSNCQIENDISSLEAVILWDRYMTDTLKD